ncbi:hypothetical protein Bpfe_008023, partial [Biomphalaria pfeifferi]
TKPDTSDSTFKSRGSALSRHLMMMSVQGYACNSYLIKDSGAPLGLGSNVQR